RRRWAGCFPTSASATADPNNEQGVQMHNVDVESVEATARAAADDPAAVCQQVSFTGEWQTESGAPQFRGLIPVPGAEPVVFEADFPPPMGGSGAAPNPLAYCFWGGLA